MSGLGDEQLRRLRDVAARPELADPEVPEADTPAVVGQGRYEILEKIAQGGMGTIHRARDRQLDREVAIKLLHARDGAGDLERRMMREARILARLEHPGIVPVHDLGSLADGRIWLAMKLVRGERWDRHVVALTGRNERLRLLLRVCEAVGYAHASGVIHRDLKPANIMVGPFGEVLVLDWGVAKLLGDPDTVDRPPAEAPTVVRTGPLGDPTATRAGSVLGTPGYMAPEQAAGLSARVDGRADVHALGAMLRELIAPGDSPAPAPLRAVADRATAHDPADRYPSVEAFARDLAAWLDGETVSAYREKPWETLRRWAGRYRTALLVIGSYIVVRWIVYWIART